MTRVRIQQEPFDAQAESRVLTEVHADIGGLVVFTGLCRSESGRLAALELEHYPGMAEAEIERVIRQAEARWPLMGVRVVHRYGKLKPGEEIVLVAVASAHRGAAFAAAEFIMDVLKTSAPFWKREHPVDGTVGDWVEAKGADDAAVQRWR